MAGFNSPASITSKLYYIDSGKKIPNKILERKRFVGLTYQKVKYLLMKNAVVLGLAKV